MTAGEQQVLWTSQEAVAATGGRCTMPFEVAGVTIDSRNVEPGDLFVAIKGPNFDGHDFVAEALVAGAAAAVVHRVPIGVSGGLPVLMVDDTLTALEGLGAAARARTSACIVAITGSVGKTGVKEALRIALSEQGAVSANRGNLNNLWGLPLSLARMPSGTAFGIFEIGMNHAGEIEPLSRMARPHVALITNVESVHGAYFRNIEEIADAKAEVFAGLEAGGVAVLNRDSPHYQRLADAARNRGVGSVIGFGAHKEAEFRLEDVVADGDGLRIKAEVTGTALSYRVGVSARHWAINSLAVLAAVAAAGGDVKAAAGTLDRLTEIEGRGRRHTVHIAGGSFELIDESYNASPIAVSAALETLGSAGTGPGGRRIAVLGDMLELGEASEQAHLSLAGPLEKNGIDLVFTIGPGMARLSDALPKAMRGGHAAVSEEMVPLIRAAVRAGDVVTVKGSLGIRVGMIARALLEMDMEVAGRFPAFPPTVSKRGGAGAI